MTVKQTGLNSVQSTPATQVDKPFVHTAGVTSQTSFIPATEDATQPASASSPNVATSAMGSAQPVVIVKQFQSPKPYSGQTSHRSFRQHFERVAKANGWISEAEKMQNLALVLEGPTVECLREARKDEPGAYERLWTILAHRFGFLDESVRAMRKFESRKQLEGESVAEYEQALRTLYREARSHKGCSFEA